MQIFGISLITAAVIYVLMMLYYAAKTGKVLKTLLLSVLSGVVALTLLNLTSGFTGVSIAVNPWTVGAAATFGIPAVIAILTVRTYF